ncbi:uncharacterized protein LOC107997026 [Apis cerana]|uniref:Uncharacterized protein n=2 Tax=Apis cerana TaxID=7461 RepID=A0A2A3EHA6_APICC|nr:uncharacterized protein LOC107997026 [Apis cerana]PBC30546.1 hypothetical protein APICC_08736 [Apis cerana cerana]
MSFYLRSIPNKFTSFVNIRRQITDINYRPPKNVKSLFLEEFLDAQTNSITNFKEKPLNSMAYLSRQNVLFSSFNNIKSSKTLNKKHNWTKQQMIKLYYQKQNNIQIQNVTNSYLTYTSVLKTDTQWEISPEHLKNKYNVPFKEMVPAKRIFNNDVLFKSEKDKIFYAEISPNVKNVNEMQTSEDRKSFETQLQSVFDVLRNDLPLLFVQSMNYSIYTKDLIFINNIKGTTTIGIEQYLKQIALLRLVGHLKFAYVKLKILKMTMHPEDNSIKVRWRIVGASGTRVFLTFWKIKIFNAREQVENKSAWYDGFSTFYLNNDGKIFKHVVDKTMPDQNIEEKIKIPVEAKLALFIALLDSNFVRFWLKQYPEFLQIK